MTSELDPPSAGGSAPEELWAEVGRYGSAGEGFDHGLVVLAMGGSYWLREEKEPGGYRLLVPAEAAEPVREQLEIFDRESAGWPPRAPRRGMAPRTWRPALFIALLWALGALGVFFAQQRWPAVTEAGAMDARAVFAGGEWWRPFTALFLHADLGHLASNVAAGVFLFAAVLSLFGRATGLLLLGASSVLANVAVGAARYPDEYRSLGASTALSAGLGLLTGRAVRTVLAGTGARAWRALFAPLGAGLTMLMLFGAGEAPVDVPAHAAGFGSGLIAGFVFADLRPERAGHEIGV